MRHYWAATPRLARAVFILGVFALAHFVGLWLLYLFNPEPGSNPLPGVLLFGTLTGIPFLAIVAMIGVGLRSTAAATVRMAAVGAAVMALGGIVILLLMLTAPSGAHLGALEYAIGATAGVIGAAYAVVSYLGFRAASHRHQGSLTAG